MTNPVSRRAFLVGVGSLAFAPVAKHMQGLALEAEQVGAPVGIEQFQWDDQFRQAYMQNARSMPRFICKEVPLKDRLFETTAVARIDDGERFQETDEAEA